MVDEQLIPIKVGDIIKQELIGFGNEGDPMLKFKDFILFIKNLKGEKPELNTLFEVRVTKVFPKFGIVELV